MTKSKYDQFSNFFDFMIKNIDKHTSTEPAGYGLTNASHSTSCACEPCKAELDYHLTAHPDYMDTNTCKYCYEAKIQTEEDNQYRYE